MTNKTYEEMTEEERRKRAEEAFVWKEGDIEIIDPGNPEDDDVYPDEEEEEPFEEGDKRSREEDQADG